MTSIEDLVNALKRIQGLKDDLSKKIFASTVAHVLIAMFEFFEANIEKLLDDAVIQGWVKDFLQKNNITWEDIQKMRRRDLITLILRVLEEHSDEVDLSISLKKAPKSVKFLIKALRGIVRRLTKDKSPEELWCKINEYLDKYVDSRELKKRFEYYRKVCPNLMKKTFMWFLNSCKKIPLQKQ